MQATFKKKLMQTNIMSSKDVYFFEESRHKSFKFWPFDEEKPCNIKKVILQEAGSIM